MRLEDVAGAYGATKECWIGYKAAQALPYRLKMHGVVYQAFEKAERERLAKEQERLASEQERVIIEVNFEVHRVDRQRHQDELIARLQAAMAELESARDDKTAALLCFTVDDLFAQAPNFDFDDHDDVYLDNAIAAGVPVRSTLPTAPNVGVASAFAM